MSDDGWVKTRFHREADGGFTLQSIQDVEPIIEQNKAFQNTPQKSDWGRHVASIPLVMIEKWGKEAGVNLLALPKDEFHRFIKRKIDDPDYRWLRTDGGGPGQFLVTHPVIQ